MVPDPASGSLWRFAKALWPRSIVGRLLCIAVPLLLILSIVAPFVSAADTVLALLGRVVAPLVETATGRLVLLNLLLALAILVAFVTLRERLRALRSGLVLQRHLDGMAALVDGERPAARELLRRVATATVSPPSGLPDLACQARLALARLEIEAGAAGAALRWLAEIRPDGLEDEFAHSLARLRFQALDAVGDVLQEQLEREVRDALAHAPRDRALLGRLRELFRQRGALREVVDVQQQIVDASPARDLAAERSRLAADLVAAGRSVLQRDPAGAGLAREFAERASRIVGDDAAAAILRGDALRADGQVLPALRAYASAGDLDGLGRAAALLDAFPGAVSPREVLDAFPLDGGLLLVARECARRGDSRAAQRACRLALRRMPGRPAIAAAVAEVLHALGLDADAEAVLQEAWRSAVASDRRPC